MPLQGRLSIEHMCQLVAVSRKKVSTGHYDNGNRQRKRRKCGP